MMVRSPERGGRMDLKKPLAAAIVAIAVAAGSASQAPAAESGKISVDLYVMSLCPFGVQAENGIFPAAKALRERVDLQLHFIGQEGPGADGKPAFTALHGEPEVRENIRQVCAMELFADRYMDYILERNKSYKGIDWRTPAKAAGIDANKLEACFKGSQGEALYRKNLEAARKRGADASPTIDIDGQPYTRARSQGWVTVALCEAM
ncbi:MAG: hypothetical protein HY554_03585 [Elusimicrobia bacterium]|nr:hypothetical protein [Elusimicrobiota bacterium]